jgi:lipid-A-disaccharide synthase
MRIALVAGETSGDLLGAGLIRALQEKDPSIEFEGIAGPAMEAAGCKVLADAEELAVMGLVEPLRRIPRLLKIRKMLHRHWLKNRPDAFVGIDAPDFNLGLEAKLRAASIRTVHYVSPSVWAWRQGRVKKIGRAADCVLCLLPFEKAFYDEHGVPADFVGHPMADRSPLVPDITAARAKLELLGSQVLAVLPGSRQSEVSRLGPVFAQTCKRLADSNSELEFVAPMATPALREMFASHLAEAAIDSRFTLVDGEADTIIEAADVVLVASGTASLQAALLQKPMVGAYRLGRLTYALAKNLKLVKVPYFTLPNLLTSEPMVPEFLQDDANPVALAAAIDDLLKDAPRRSRIAQEFAKLRSILACDADEHAASAVYRIASAS